MNRQPRIGAPSIAIAVLLAMSSALAQQLPPATDAAQPPATPDENRTAEPAKPEKQVLVDPDSKMYMPCRDPNDVKSSEQSAPPVKLNPKAAVMSEEAAKQHAFKPSPHKVDCPKT